MSPAQTSLYFREWGKVRAYYLAKGIDPKQAGAKRHELHLTALGSDKSSKSFTNADLDKVLAAFYAISSPSDLTAQLRQIDQPTHRLNQLQDACWKTVFNLPKIKLSVDPQFHAENYLNSIARSLAGVPFLQLGEKDVARVLGILTYRLKQPLEDEADRLEAVDKNPF